MWCWLLVFAFEVSLLLPTFAVRSGGTTLGPWSLLAEKAVEMRVMSWPLDSSPLRSGDWCRLLLRLLLSEFVLLGELVFILRENEPLRPSNTGEEGDAFPTRLRRIPCRLD